MKIAIDISQIVYEGTGVARYVVHMVQALAEKHGDHEYILFGSSFRRFGMLCAFAQEIRRTNPRVRTRFYRIPPRLLAFIWNRLHIIPAEVFVGSVDVFWSSDWTQPPLRRALGATTVHDLSVFRYPKQHHGSIVREHGARLGRAVSSCSVFFCDSEATKKDFLGRFPVRTEYVRVVYPGYIPL